MHLLFWLSFIFVPVIIIFLIKTTNVIKENDTNTQIMFLSNFIGIVFFGYMFFPIISFLIALNYVSKSEFIIIMIVDILIKIIFFIKIYLNSKELFNNISNDKFLIKENSALTKDIALNFIYMAITHIVVGLIFNIFYILSGVINDFRITTNNHILITIAFGFILLIISIILDKSIEDDENTIKYKRNR